MEFCCNGFGWGGMGWGSLGLIGPILSVMFFVGLLAVLGLGTVWAIRRFSHGKATTRPTRTGGDPLEIAQRRLAAGEITVAEFGEIRERLRR